MAVAGATRASIPVEGGQVTCPDRALATALRSLPDDADPLERACVAESQERMYVVTAALMGLVLISGLLTRRHPPTSPPPTPS